MGKEIKNEFEEYKIAVLGERGVGKSALIINFIQNTFLSNFDPTIEDCYRKIEVIDGIPCTFDIFDMAGVGEYHSLLDNTIISNQGFLLLYSITDRESFKNIKILRNHILQVKDKDPEQVPIILVGTKLDLEKDEREVSNFEGNQLSEILEIPFFETSAKSKINVDETFFQLVREIRSTLIKFPPKYSFSNEKIQDEILLNNDSKYIKKEMKGCCIIS